MLTQFVAVVNAENTVSFKMQLTAGIKKRRIRSVCFILSGAGLI